MEESVNSRIFRIMKEKGITQQQLADYLGVGQSTVAMWRKRDCPPPINYLTQISTLLNVSIDYLATGSDNPTAYKLTTTEQLIIREFRTASEETQNEIFKFVLEKCDEHYVESRSDDLWKTLSTYKPMSDKELKELCLSILKGND